MSLLMQKIHFKVLRWFLYQVRNRHPTQLCLILVFCPLIYFLIISVFLFPSLSESLLGSGYGSRHYCWYVLVFFPSITIFFQEFFLNDISHHSLTLLMLDLAHLPGGTQLHHCPVQPYIPIYLIVLGVMGILSLILTFCASTRKSRKSCILSSTALCIVHFFNFCWLIAGGRKWQQCKLLCVFKALKWNCLCL